ncbi:MAG: hypothetical protein IKE35_07400 [Lachnospiraceae bacterium]|nr:hypothetical protein [Lachnospiraceae bacterium]
MTGISDSDKIEITDGLTEQDKVITTWASQLRDGMEVEVEGSALSREDSMPKDSSTDKIEVVNEIAD